MPFAVVCIITQWLTLTLRSLKSPEDAGAFEHLTYVTTYRIVSSILRRHLATSGTFVSTIQSCIVFSDPCNVCLLPELKCSLLLQDTKDTSIDDPRLTTIDEVVL